MPEQHSGLHWACPYPVKQQRVLSNGINLFYALLAQPILKAPPEQFAFSR